MKHPSAAGVVVVAIVVNTGKLENDTLETEARSDRTGSASSGFSAVAHTVPFTATYSWLPEMGVQMKNYAI